MKPFDTYDAPVCPLGLVNVDTDQLIPARFMQTPRSEGYGRFLLHDLRRDTSGALRPDFPLNDPRYASAGILIARKNFGCGSSREAAVYVLIDSGFRCVIAPSFGDIFASNAIKNGLLPAIVTESDAEGLLAESAVLQGSSIHIDLAAQTITVGNSVVEFAIRNDWKKRLINGWDDVDLTKSYTKDIEAFVAADVGTRPWAAPRR
ncbi:MAG: 3-isopropylmalate dehydratase small subunit [Xanthobacteraceae bacterium]